MTQSHERGRGKFQQILTPLQNAVTVTGLILCIVFSFLLICNLTIIVKGTLFPEKPPSVLGITPMTVLSGSMSGEAEDHIEIGDLIFVAKVKPEKLYIGDIIAFMDGSVVVTHRITEIYDNNGLEFITKGDANNAPDQKPVTAENLVGKYKGRIPGMGNFVLFLKSPLGMLLFVGVPVIGFICYDILRRQRYVNYERQRRQELEADLKRLQEMLDKPNAEKQGQTTPEK